jgi:hypothetical protein
VSASSWPVTVTTTPGSATLSVRGVIGRKPGRIATVPVVLADVTAPKGSFSSTWTNNDAKATLTQDSLTDDGPLSGVTRRVNWDDGSGTEVWPGGTTTISHTYPLTSHRYLPTVTIEDAAHNSRTVDAPAIVINDDEAPTGTFANETATAWASFSLVTVSQSDINDNWTPDGLITRSVDWGDGTSATAWSSSGPATHVYATAGSFTPVVTLTDESGNATPVSTSEIVVTVDTFLPTVKVRVPRAKHSVKAWRTVHGKAADAQTGLKRVSLKAVEKRRATWYAYHASTHTWVPATSRTKAFKKAQAFHPSTDAGGRWTARLAKLKKGTLVLRAHATDQVGNRSARVTRSALLTRR